MRNDPLLELSILRRAYQEAVKSPDPSTQLGAVVVAHNGLVIGQEHNRFPLGYKATPERLADRESKRVCTVHAEVGAILAAVRWGHGDKLSLATLYCPWYACPTCAGVIIESGIRRVVGHGQHPGNTHEAWRKSVEKGLEMLQDAGIVCDYVDGQIGGGIKVRLNFETWEP